MTRGRIPTGAVSRMALLTAVALVLGYVESLLPLTGIPGVKLGLANTVLLYGLYMLPFPSTALLMVMKVLLSGFLFGGVSAMIYSLSGGVLSLLSMAAAKRIPGVSVIGVSVLGAVSHNAGQLLIAGLVAESRAVLAYLPVLLLSGLITGILTGIIARRVLRGLEKGGDR